MTLKEPLWIDEDTAKALTLTKEFDPSPVWVDRRPTDDQARNSKGVPLWDAEALIGMGWNGDVESVRVRIASATKPTAAPDPMKIARAYGFELPGSASAGHRGGVRVPPTEGQG